MSRGFSTRVYGTLPDGRAVDAFTLDNGRGLRLSFLALGGIVTALEVPDRHGVAANVVLALPSLDAYRAQDAHLGTIVGRCANRIAGGRFVLDGVEHRLPVNDGPNTLHGGPRGFGTRLWSVEPCAAAAPEAVAAALRYTSAAGEEGFPGTLEVEVRYTVTADATWRVDYRATTDAPTLVNLTHHAYWNLAGHGTAMDHVLTLPASRYAQVDSTLIPTTIAEVDGTPFDFRVPTPIGTRLRTPHPQLLRARGYDHHWIIDAADSDRTRSDRPDDATLALAARLADPASGRVLEIHTSAPGVQFYSGNFLDGRLVGAAGATLRQGDGVCLETQHVPDSPHRTDVPPVVLRPGTVWRSATEHRFRAG